MSSIEGHRVFPFVPIEDMIISFRGHLGFSLIYLLPTLLSASPQALEEVRSITRAWVDAEKTLSLEVIQWEEQKALLHDLTEVAETRLKQMENRLAETESSTSLADRERAELLEKEAYLQARLQQVETFLAETEPALRDLKTRLPEPLQVELQALYQRIPDDPKDATASVGERMRTAMEILSQVRAFDARVSVTERIQVLPGRDEEVAVQTLWIGLGQAYYLAPDDAGYGIPGEAGWQWHSQPDLAERIRKGIAVAEGRGTTPSWIQLPVSINAEEAQ